MTLWPFGRKGFGAKKDKPDKRDYVYSAGQSSLWVDSSIEDCIPYIYDQGRTNTCVPTAVFGAYRTAMVAAGYGDPGPLSIPYAYWFGRTFRQRFTDGGCYPRELLKFVQKRGSPPAEKWPFDKKLIQRRPPFSLSDDAVDCANFEFERCRDVEDVADALRIKRPVLFGCPVDKEFVKHEGPDTIDKIGEPFGRHMTYLVANDPSIHAFRDVGSYGIGYREQGKVWISWDVIDRFNPNDVDLYALKVLGP